ncbi:hypothetical protein CSE16_08250 [Solibacillus sp. R5-41]|uniref:immunity 22 family protein n=1 Tax=Solibacillus sp. R5-41 TaxID=2048654 RepID=UPI000C127030|nr:immunity 22 family protein [Solibacillus sp. R5-41]ATP40039.1 hypothetical protein CSE16_08250 [Solibacillus sp. R5-41]
MEQEGYLSLWVGTFESNEDFRNYLLIPYNEDGDAIPSNFEKDFHIEHYDEDFIEVEFFDENVKNLSRLLDGCSYDDVVIPNFININGESLTYSVNCMILLYNFQYSTKGQSDLKYVKYLGNVRYK